MQSFMTRLTTATLLLLSQAVFAQSPAKSPALPELGPEHAGRLAQAEQELTEASVGLPKNVMGNLQAAAARRALHRLFVQRHALTLPGLQGSSWSDAPGLRPLFKARIYQGGLSIKELAALAVQMELAIEGETQQRVRAALAALNLTEAPDSVGAAAALRAFLASTVLGARLEDLSPAAVLAQLREVEGLYPFWASAQRLLPAPEGEQSLESLTAAAVRLGGRWQRAECGALREQLEGLESAPGRVALSDFRGAGGGAAWAFSEGPEELWAMGALRDSEKPSVLVANYLAAPANCLVASDLYEACCPEACEALLAGLEQRLRRPQAAAEAVLEALEQELGERPTEAMALRLHEVARFHKEAVPLHGVLFAEWLHEAYPRSCPSPHAPLPASSAPAESCAAEAPPAEALPQELEKPPLLKALVFLSALASIAATIRKMALSVRAGKEGKAVAS